MENKNTICKEKYEKPEIETQEITVGVFGAYSSTNGPVNALQPFFGLCCS